MVKLIRYVPKVQILLISLSGHILLRGLRTLQLKLKSLDLCCLLPALNVFDAYALLETYQLLFISLLLFTLVG